MKNYLAVGLSAAACLHAAAVSGGQPVPGQPVLFAMLGAKSAAPGEIVTVQVEPARSDEHYAVWLDLGRDLSVRGQPAMQMPGRFDLRLPDGVTCLLPGGAPLDAAVWVTRVRDGRTVTAQVGTIRLFAAR